MNLTMHRNSGFLPRLGLSALALAGLGFASVPANHHFMAGQKAKVSGVIMSRDGDSMTLRESNDLAAVVVLGDQTKVQVKKGVFKFRREDMDLTALVPGLRVDASGVGNTDGQLIAQKITFNPDDFKTARSVDIRVSPLEAKQAQTEQDVQKAQASADTANAGVAELHSRVSSLDDYDTKYSTTVYFETNRYDLSDQSKKDLDTLVQNALPLKGYMIEVAGYADTTGDVKRNQELSEQRAEAVVQYLQQVGRVPLRRILAPAGLGTSQSAADNNTAEGRSKNRRVEVRVIVNKGQETAPAKG